MTAGPFELSVTTQGPLYPPSEIMNRHGEFIVVGAIPGGDGAPQWGGAIVAAQTPVPPFGQRLPYQVTRAFQPERLGDLAGEVLYTLPLPLPANNYPMLFAPEQRPDAHFVRRPSYPLHQAPIPDERPGDGRRPLPPITLGSWLAARGALTVALDAAQRTATFAFEFERLVPHSLYTVMALRQRDLDPERPTRPGPLGIPNAFLTDGDGRAQFWATLPDPFPSAQHPGANRVVNVVVLFMSAQMSHGGAIGLFGLGGDIHAQLKFRTPMFADLLTHA
jgi:hypothetical protein